MICQVFTAASIMFSGLEGPACPPKRAGGIYCLPVEVLCLAVLQGGQLYLLRLCRR